MSDECVSCGAAPEAVRYGPWRIYVWRVVPSIRPDAPLYFWSLTHDDAGHLRGSHNKTEASAIADAKAWAVRFWPSLADVPEFAVAGGVS